MARSRSSQKDVSFSGDGIMYPKHCKQVYFTLDQTFMMDSFSSKLIQTFQKFSQFSFFLKYYRRPSDLHLTNIETILYILKQFKAGDNQTIAQVRAPNWSVPPQGCSVG